MNEPDRCTPLEALLLRANSDPGRVAFIAEDEEWTCARVARDSAALARYFIHGGIKPGARIAVQMKNRPELVLSCLAAWRAGAVVVPIDTSYDGVKLQSRIKQIKPCLYLGEAECIDSLRHVPTKVLTAEARLVLDLPADNHEARAWPVLDTDPGDADACPIVDLDEPAALLATSGTTGESKLAVWTHRILAAFAATASARGVDADDVYPFASPLVHASAFRMLLTCLLTGAKAILIADINGDSLLDAIAKHRCTTFLALPGMCEQVAKAYQSEWRDTSSLQLCMVAGDVCPESVVRDCGTAFGRPLLSIWGSTEDSGAAIPATRSDAGTRFLPEAEIRLVGLDGIRVADGEPGELLLRSPTTATGYWISPDHTDPLPEDWLHSGDLMSRAPDENFFYHGRLDDVAVRNGRRILLLGVEGVLQRQSGVKDAVVVALPDTRMGDRIGAAVVLDERVESTAVAHIMSKLHRDLAADEVPDRIAILNAIARKPKVDRKAIGQIVAEDGHDAADILMS